MKLYYSDEKNVQIVLALLKAHGIRKIILSPGSSNLAFSGSVQNDSYFDIYSAVDERHAAYLACGMSFESHEPVVINCTGATSSRNYLPALTEAYYRKIPILAITSSQPKAMMGQLYPQVTDRYNPPKDAVRFSVSCPPVGGFNDFGYCQRIVNEAILELWRNGGGPVHINLEMSYCTTFNTTSLPFVKKISRITRDAQDWPELPVNSKIALLIGSHASFDAKAEALLSKFVNSHNVAVLCDHTSSYSGMRSVHSAFLCSQKIKGNPEFKSLVPDIVLQIGEISGDAPTTSFVRDAPCIWRISPDGQIRGKIDCVFEMSEADFWEHYTREQLSTDEYYLHWKMADDSLRAQMPELPFSNPWIASVLKDMIPEQSVVHFGILNSLRSWNYYRFKNKVRSTCNVGGFGIDGCVSSLIGASLVHPESLYFGIVGDLAFFYDMNAIGNRHVGKNVRLLIVNNGIGAEFTMYNNPTSKFGTRTADFIAAGGHFGNQSRKLLRHYAEDLGFLYIFASSKKDFMEVVETFVSADSDRSIIFECFTNSSDESAALELLNGIIAFVDFKQKFSRLIPERMKRIARDIVS